MKKNIINPYALIMILLLVFLAPAGIAFAGSSGQVSLQVGTQTAIPTIFPTPTIEQTPVSPLLALSQIPGLLPTNIKALLPDTTDRFTFEQFGLSEITMRGPFAARGYYFDLPLTWKMNQDAVLQLAFDTYYTGSDSAASQPSGAIPASNYIGTVEIQYNYTTIGKVDLTKEGRTQIDIPIPLDVLNRYGSNQGHSILLILDSGVNCNFNSNTTVVVRSISQLYLPHDLIAPPVDLRLLPSPFYQDSFNQNTAIVVVPDQPSAGELQAAMSISAGFGSMTYNNLLISLIPVSQATEDVLASTNLIFVGKANGLPLLQQISLSAPVSNGVFASKDSSPTDGIVQLAISPWNRTKVVMVVGGNDDTGVVNGARAVSTGTLQVGSDPSLSLVSGVQLTTPVFNPTDVNQTFADLGYDSVVTDLVGLNVLDYTFNISPNYVIGPDAYLDLNFSHTSLLEYQRSTIVVNLNGQPVGSVRLSDDTVGQGNAKIFLPASAARPGINNLNLEINLEPRNECVNPLLNGLWMRVDSSSSLHLPFVPNLTNTSTLIDLSKYPFPFSFDPVMKDLAFILADNDPVGWNVASQLASQLGNTNRIQLAGLDAYYADSVPETAKQERNLIIIGKPSKLGILSQMYDALPAPFEPGTDLATQKNIQVSYRLGAGVDVGYLELLSAPWNSNRTILYVGGSSDLGVRWAGAALQFGRLRSQLKGNLAFINGEQVVSTETRILHGNQDALVTAVPFNVTPEANNQPQQVVVERPVWILPAIFISLGGVILLLVILGVQAISRRRSEK